VSASRPIRELREKAKLLLIGRLKENRADKREDRLSVRQVSEILGISRQAVYDIKEGKYCPSLSLIHRMCETWHEKFDLGGIVINHATLAPRRHLGTEPHEVQGNLFEAIAHLDTRSFEVIRTKPMGRALEITLRLTVPVRNAAGRS
jgi:DNA-binding XRE family transcriptional regulator